MVNPVVTVEVLKNANELWTMENAFLKAVGEEPMPPEHFQRLMDAVNEERIIFFAARMGERIVGICSVSLCFSTFACRLCGVFDDFFVLPEERGNGIARLLASSAQQWCRKHECASLTVGCAPKNVGMYRSLGFDAELGRMLACNL